MIRLGGLGSWKLGAEGEQRHEGKGSTCSVRRKQLHLRQWPLDMKGGAPSDPQLKPESHMALAPSDEHTPG